MSEGPGRIAHNWGHPRAEERSLSGFGMVGVFRAGGHRARFVCLTGRFALGNHKHLWVVPHGDRWAYRREGSDRVSDTFRTQARAEAAAKRVARAEKGEVFTQGRDGHIRDRDSYGGDPFPPRDKKH